MQGYNDQEGLHSYLNIMTPSYDNYNAGAPLIIYVTDQADDRRHVRHCALRTVGI